MSELTEWYNFYVIVGAAAGALIGLQFVAISLIAQNNFRRTADAGAAFATPTIVHFIVALLLSAVVSVPWHGVSGAADVWGLVGLGGIAYEILVGRRMNRQTHYRPVFEDWLCHLLLPLAAYVMLAGSALLAGSHTRAALFVVAAASLLLLFVGIHNTWDAVTYHVFVNLPAQDSAGED